MSTFEALPYDPYRLGRGFGEGGDGRDYTTGRGEGGPASARVIVGYGFWIFLLSDVILFSCFFATFAVLRTATAGGPSGADLFDPWRVAAETTFLLLSSFVCGMAAIATRARSHLWTQAGLLVTGLLGLGFLFLEAQEFATMIGNGNGPDRSAFLSSFFALVGLHGLHVTAGLFWMAVMMVEVVRTGLTPRAMVRLNCLSLFWHFLDVVWIGVFTFVYLMGTLR